MRYLSILLFVVLLGGCASNRYGEFAKLEPAVINQIALDSAQEIRKNFAPASVHFDMPKKVGRFGEALERYLREDGFAMGAGGGVIDYAIDNIGDNYRVLLTVDGMHYTRAYAWSNNTIAPLGAWAVWGGE